eukprot:3589356-Pyramimonas_sp.AAC.1
MGSERCAPVEVRHVGPEAADVVVVIVHLPRRAVVLVHHLQPQLVEIRGRQLAVHAGGVRQLLEAVEGALPVHAVDDVVDLTHQHRQPLLQHSVKAGQ